MGFLDKIVDVLGFVEREDVEEEEVVAERPVQIAAKISKNGKTSSFASPNLLSSSAIFT